ncbi:MAG: hypothetical protein SFU99_13725 [Saprospiraceae bacterium]|nr:hypothetical protein [Saprospiraceae bacterium]
MQTSRRDALWVERSNKIHGRAVGTPYEMDTKRTYGTPNDPGFNHATETSSRRDDSP